MRYFDCSAKILLSGFLKYTVQPLALVTVFAVSLHADAVEVAGLYQGKVLVESRDDTRERQRAFAAALQQVLTKVSGRTDLRTVPIIRRALSNADDYVDAWSYGTVPAGAGRNAGEPRPGEDRIELNVTFFEPEVRSLLDSANIPVWPRNRPDTLVWLVVQDELGERQLIGSSTGAYPEVTGKLEDVARQRGLPLLLPILDFEDMTGISADNVWEMNREAVQQASARYRSESILVVRLFRSLSGELLGKSTYLFRDQIREYETYDDSLAMFIGASVGLAADELSAYYAVLLSGTDSNIKVNLTVKGVKSAKDYAGLLQYVGQLADVNSYQIASVNNQTVELTLSTGGQLRQLVETIALDRNLSPLGELTRNDNQVYMSYQWNE